MDPFRLRLFGGFALKRPSGELETDPSQRRAEAVLAVLAVCGDVGCSRDRLVGLLWAERDEHRARHGLRDALYAIRKGLAREAVAGTGDVLRLDPEMVTSDVGDFAEALDRGRLGDAVDVYRGPLLDGFYVDNAPAFGRWVERERSRLLREHQRAVKRLAKAAEQEGRWDAAAEWWARAVAEDPYNTRFVVRRMFALARAGDRANAVEEGEAHAALLRAELELEPDAAFLDELGRVRTGEIETEHFFTPPPQPIVHLDDVTEEEPEE